MNRGDRILIDTSILVRMRHVDDPSYAVCAAALARLAEAEAAVCVGAQVFIEYWAVATRPREANGLGLDPHEAEADLPDLEQGLVWLLEPPDIGAVWRGLVNQYDVRGRQVHDTRLVALMISHGIPELLTLNAGDFQRYTAIRCRTPEEVVVDAP